MTPDQVRQMIQQEIHKSQQAQRFNLNSIPRHTHNGVDSPITFQPTFTYGCAVNKDGTPALLPQGWTSKRNGFGSYTITHSLGSLLYVPTISQYSQTNNLISQLLAGTDTIGISWFEVAVGAVDSAFYMNVTIVNSKSTKFPVYYGTLVNPGSITG